MNNCIDCNTPLKPLFGAKWYCPNDCDKKPSTEEQEDIFVWDNERGKTLWVCLHLSRDRTFFKSNPKQPGYVRWKILRGDYNVHTFKHYVKITEKEGGNQTITLLKAEDNWIPMWSTGGTRHIAPNSYTCFFPDDISCRQHFSSNPSEYVVQSGEYSQIVMRYPGMNRDMVLIQNTSKTKDLVVGKK